MIIISTPEGDVELTGDEKAEFLNALPGEVDVIDVKPPLTEEKLISGFKAMGMTQEQINAFLAAIA